MNNGWNQTRYEAEKMACERALRIKSTTPYDYMQQYKKAIIADDFEKAKAITDVLKPLNYDTADTHAHIEQLKNV